MSNFILDETRCTGCGTCTFVCPKSLLVLENGRPVMPEEIAHKCNSCGQCTAYCPEDACRQALDAGQTLPRAPKADASTATKMDLFLKARRSYRMFTARPVPRTVTEGILDAANYAPTGGNNRKIRWILTDSIFKTRMLRDMITDWMDTECRVHPVLSKRYDIDSIIARQRKGRDIILRGAPCTAFTVGPKNIVWGGVDSGIALSYFNMAAEARDIGCCFAGYAANAAKYSSKIREFLGIGEDEDCYCAIVFGYKTIHAQRIPARPPINCSFV